MKRARGYGILNDDVSRNSLWDDYVKTVKVAANFKFSQRNDYHPNAFVVGQLLETIDQNSGNFTLARVVSISGCRLKIRLEKTDELNDKWLAYDSSELRPLVDTSELFPPVTLRTSLSRWWKMLEEARSKPETCAPLESFSTVTNFPPENLFHLGEHLECIYPRYSSNLCAGVVWGLDGENVGIKLLNAEKVTVIWLHFTSIDLYPAGYGSLTNFPVQLPVSMDENMLPQPVAKRNSVNGAPLSGENRNFFDEISNKFKDDSKNNVEVNRAISQVKSNLNARITIVTSCYCGPHLRVSSGESNMTIESALKVASFAFCNHLLKTSVKYKTLFIFFLRQHFSSLSMYLAPTYANGVATLNRNDLNMLITHEDLIDFIANLKDLLGCCENFIQILRDGEMKAVTDCTKCSSAVSNESKVMYDRMTLIPTPFLPRNVREWPCSTVVAFLEEIGEPAHTVAKEMKQHQIDGEALLLLNTELLMKHFGLKAGPALKMNDIISKLRDCGSIKSSTSINL